MVDLDILTVLKPCIDSSVCILHLSTKCVIFEIHSLPAPIYCSFHDEDMFLFRACIFYLALHHKYLCTAHTISICSIISFAPSHIYFSSMQYEPLQAVALRLLLNLSFDARIRTRIVSLEMLPHLVDLMNKPPVVSRMNQ